MSKRKEWDQERGREKSERTALGTSGEHLGKGQAADTETKMQPGHTADQGQDWSEQARLPGPKIEGRCTVDP